MLSIENNPTWKIFITTVETIYKPKKEYKKFDYGSINLLDKKLLM